VTAVCVAEMRRANARAIAGWLAVYKGNVPVRLIVSSLVVGPDATIGTLGSSVTVVEDLGPIRLNPPSGVADNLIEFLAGIDTLTVSSPSSPKIIVNRYDGTVATVGRIMIEQTTSVSHAGITLTISQDGSEGPVEGLVAVPVGVSVQEVAAGLHAAGADPHEVARIFELLRNAGALVADIVVQ